MIAKYPYGMDVQRGIASFVVRFTQERWRDAQGEPHLQWRGHIRHVQGDEERSFTDAAEVIAFIQKHLTELTLNAIPGGSPMDQEKMMRESFKLWEQFAATYNSMMFEAMEKTIQQSEALKAQMDEAVERSLKAWKMPGQADQSQVVEALTKLSEQVAALTAKVEGLEKTVKKSEVRTSKE
jgi:hypothetical protein